MTERKQGAEREREGSMADLRSDSPTCRQIISAFLKFLHSGKPCDIDHCTVVCIFGSKMTSLPIHAEAENDLLSYNATDLQDKTLMDFFLGVTTYIGLESILNSCSYENERSSGSGMSKGDGCPTTSDSLDEDDASSISSVKDPYGSFSSQCLISSKQEEEQALIEWQPPRSKKGKAPIAYTMHFSDAEAVKERFAKLLLGEDVSGGARGISTNAIMNISASVFGELWKLKPLYKERDNKWRKEMDWLLSPTNYMVELVAAKQNGDNGQMLEARLKSREPCNLKHCNTEWKIASLPILEAENESSSSAMMGSNTSNMGGYATKSGKSRTNVSKWRTQPEKNGGKALIESSSRKSPQVDDDIHILVLGDPESGTRDLIYSFHQYHGSRVQVGNTGRRISYVQRKAGGRWRRVALTEINVREAHQEGTLTAYSQANGAIIAFNFNESEPNIVRSVGDWVAFADRISDVMKVKVIGILNGSQQVRSRLAGRGGSGHAGRAGSGAGSGQDGILDILRYLYQEIPVISWEFRANADQNGSWNGRMHSGLPDPITLFVDELIGRH